MFHVFFSLSLHFLYKYFVNSIVAVFNVLFRRLTLVKEFLFSQRNSNPRVIFFSFSQQLEMLIDNVKNTFDEEKKLPPRLSFSTCQPRH